MRSSQSLLLDVPPRSEDLLRQSLKARRASVIWSASPAGKLVRCGDRVFPADADVAAAIDRASKAAGVPCSVEP